MAGAIRIPNGSDKSDTSASLYFFLNTEITKKTKPPFICDVQPSHSILNAKTQRFISYSARAEGPPPKRAVR